MLKNEKRDIDGVEVSVTQFAARRALGLQAELIKLLGPSLGALLPKGGKGIDGEADLGAAVQKLADNLDPDRVVGLSLRLLADTRVGGREVKTDAEFDAAFSGKLSLLYKVLAFVLEVNFRDFFGAGGITALRDRFGTAPATPPAA